MIVVDASAIIEVLFNTPTGGALRQHLFAAGETLHVLHLTDLEVSQVLRRYAITKTLDRERAREAFDDYAALPLTPYPHSIVLPRVWELRHKLTAYDAVYIGLDFRPPRKDPGFLRHHQRRLNFLILYRSVSRVMPSSTAARV